jgi:hypothetical protein
MARCPECAGKMIYNPNTRMMTCNSCGLSLSRHDLDHYWKSIKDQNFNDDNETDRKKARRKDWLDWYSSSKSEKERY